MYSKNLITGLKVKFNLFNQPYKIGDTLTLDNKPQVIIGIQRFHYNSMEMALHIRYITQLLNESYMFNKTIQQKDNDLIKSTFTFTLKQLNKNIFNLEKRPIELHDTVYLNKNSVMAKVVEFLDIGFVGTDLKVVTLLKPIYPIEPNKAKELYKIERSKNLKVIYHNLTEKS